MVPFRAVQRRSDVRTTHNTQKVQPSDAGR